MLNINKNDAFYDLGCGTGKLNIQIYLSIPVKKNIGIELSKTRIQAAHNILKQLNDLNLIDDNHPLRFIEGNILDIDFSDGTVFYISSLCFSDALIKKLGTKLALLPAGVRIISLAKFTEIPRLKFKRENLIPMSWNEKGASTYLYEIENEEKI